MKPSWDWERELSDDLMIEAYLKAKGRCGVETVTTAGWEESKKGPLRPEAWRTSESQKRVSGPLLFETRRRGWNNSGLACDFGRNLAKQGMGHRGSVDVAANEASLQPQRQHDGT